jgi:hypothetical protein
LHRVFTAHPKAVFLFLIAEKNQAAADQDVHSAIYGW